MARRPSGLVSLIAAGAVLASVVSAAPASAPSPVAKAPAVPVLSAAPDTATAMVAARRQGSRVEVVGEGSETRTTYANPNGTMTAEITAVPTRVRRGPGWVPIDTTLVARADGTVAPKAALTELTLSGGGPGTPLVRLARAGKVFALYWPTSLGTPVLSGNTATYPEVLPGVDLVIRAERAGYQQLLVVKNAEAARNPALAAVEFRVAAEGLRVNVGDTGALRAVDDGDKPVFEAPPSVMWDASGPTPGDATTSRSASVGVTVAGTTLTVRPDLAFLTDPATVYPVTVDPGMTTPELNRWVNVLSGPHFADKNFWWGSGAGPGIAQVGKCYPDPDCNGIGVGRAYWSFFTALPGGSHVISAEFRLILSHSPDCDTWRDHEVWMTDALVSTDTTWNNQPPGQWRVRTRGVPPNCPAGQPVGFDVRGGVNTVGWATYSLRAAQETDGYAWRKYYGNGALVSITYNRPPNAPYDMRTDPPLPAPCRWCGDIPYVGNESIRLIASLSDPDGEQVEGQWHIDTNGALEERWDAWQNSGLAHSEGVDLRDKHDKRVMWHVNAWDDCGLACPVDKRSSGWVQGPGPFVVDRIGVDKAPTVSGTLYQEDNRWHGGVGVPDTFTFGANGIDDIDHYVYWLGDRPSDLTTVDAISLGGPASIRIAPQQDGPNNLYVQSVDRAGHSSPAKVVHFYVRAGNGPYAQYSFEGNANDTAFLGDRHGTLHGNAIYTPGAVSASLLLDGRVGSDMTAPNAVRTDASFSVSAWVRPDQAPDRIMGVVGQDGNNAGGWYLEYRNDAPGGKKRWAFMLTSEDKVDPNGYFAYSPHEPQQGRWTQLTGVVDRAANEIRLYVDGVPAETTKLTGFVPWHAGGSLAVGRDFWNGKPVNPWAGAIDEVQVYDRVLSEAEIRAAVGRSNVQVGQWKFDETTGTTARNSVEGGDDGVLVNGAAFAPDGAVNGSVKLDGVDDHVVTSGPAVRTDQSFTVAAWVKAESLVTDGKSMTAVSQDGTKQSGFYLQYESGVVNKWVFATMSTDGDTPAKLKATSSVPPQLNGWVHLAGVYDATTRQLRIYVGGRSAPGDAMTLPADTWNAAGPVAVGRARFAGKDTDFWPGSVDEVRLYSRALSDGELQGIVSRSNVAAGSWKLDGAANDSSGRGLHGTLTGGPQWTAGQSSDPDPADLAVQLNGTGAHVSAPHAVDTDKSYSVSAWARLDRLGGYSSVVSQDGDHASAFMLRASADGHWAFVHIDQDVDGGQAYQTATGTVVQVGVWTHLVGLYSKESHQIELYVNGVSTGPVAAGDGFNAMGGLQIGREKWASQLLDYFPGAIDDVTVYNRPLFASEIRVMAGRDLTLVHNWKLDEGTGATAADSVGARGGTLTGSASHVDGRMGNAVGFDGKTDGAVSTSGADLRTDRSFTVAAWVYLNEVNPDCADVCKIDAVSMDGGTGKPFSKFRLGHVKDNDQAPKGKWMFEMPEPDGSVTRAAVAVRTGQIQKWVHLIGVYDAPAKRLHVYVNIGGGEGDSGDGTLLDPWQATGGLRIGRGQVNGSAAEFWPGSVDDVRLYTGTLDYDRLAALYRSYPAPSAPAKLPVADAGYWTFDEGTGTAVADSSGKGHPATVRNPCTDPDSEKDCWIGGRKGYSSWLNINGTAQFAETEGPVLDTAKSFSVTTWAFIQNSTGGNQTVVAQDRNQVSSFLLQYGETDKKWAVVVPTADASSPNRTVLFSAEPAQSGLWTHLGVVYDAGLHRLSLYVNGRLSAVHVGVSIMDSTGRFSMGRARWNGANTDFVAGGVDDVRAFGTALSDGEIRKIHDDTTLAQHGWYGFEGNVVDKSWRQNPTTLTGGASYVPGVRGQALQLDGTTGEATTDWLAANTIDSFTVSAWAKLSATDHDATILGQDGVRNSAFVLQYNKNIGRWIFGAATQDADTAPYVYAYSPQAPVVGAWTHLTGVYDYPAHELRLYVDGELIQSGGVRKDAPILRNFGRFSIGRGRLEGKSSGFFPGAIDELQTDLGVATDEEIRRRGGFPAPAGGQFGRFANPAKGDHYSANSGGDHTVPFAAVPAGYRFEGSLGTLLPAQQTNTKQLYACMFGTDEFTSADPNCEGLNNTKLGALGWIYTTPPAGVATIALYRCNTGLDHFESGRQDCEGPTIRNEGLLGYTIAYSPLVRYFHPLDAERATTVYGAPAGYQWEGTIGLLSMVAQPGTQSLYTCRDGLDEFASLDAGCEGKIAVASMGRIWSQQPPSPMKGMALYRCTTAGGDRFLTLNENCDGHPVAGRLQLGYVLSAIPAAAAGA